MRARRIDVLGLALLAVVLGRLSKLYVGPSSGFVVGYAWDVLGSAAIYGLARAAWATPRVRRLAVGVLLALFANELLQLVQHPWLAALRGTAVGSVVLGSGFDPFDFAAIAAGVGAAAGLDRYHRGRTKGPWRGRDAPGSRER